jgi:uncharacterized membrane protein
MQPRREEQSQTGLTDFLRGRQVNVGPAERSSSVAAGAILTALGISRQSLPGLLVAGIGGALIYRGATGHCAMYEAMGIDTSDEGPQRQKSEEEIARSGIHVEQAFLINRSAADLYTFWRDFTNLPRFMTHLERVDVQEGGRRSHWVAQLTRMAGGKLEWDAEITREDVNSAIAWRSLPGSDIDTAGQITFAPALGDRGTEVHVYMNFIPPAGGLARMFPSLFTKATRRMIRSDLRRFKQLMEIGEIPTIDGQPMGSCLQGGGTRYREM